MPPPSSTLSKIVALLGDGERHTGTQMAETLCISRAAVWKAMQRLKAYKIHVQAEHQGYQLASPFILLDAGKIEALLNRSDLTLEVVETLPSTTDYLKQKRSLANLSFCFAEHQSKGRGRLGREWVSPFGCNIYCSFSYIVPQSINEISGLSLVVGLCIIKALESLNPLIRPCLKWPNDIYLENQKMGGILIDIVAEAHGTCTAIIGFGLDVNMRDSEAHPWTSLEHVVGEKLDRNWVSARIIDSLLEGLDRFREEGFAPFLSTWEQYDLLKGQDISVQIGSNLKTGVARGIDPHGYLRLETSPDKIELISCGDTTIV